MIDPALHISHPTAGSALVPITIERLGGCPELHGKVAGKVLRLSLAPLLAPEADQCSFMLPIMTRASEPPMKDRRFT